MSTNYINDGEVYPPIAFAGTLAEPAAPHATDFGFLHVPTTGQTRKPRPGDPLLWDGTLDRWRLPASAAEARLITAILTYRRDEVATEEHIVEFANNDEIQFFTMGGIWLRAGAAIERDALLLWNHATPWRWGTVNRPTAFNQLFASPIYNATEGTAADNDLIKARIGYGRVI